MHVSVSDNKEQIDGFEVMDGRGVDVRGVELIEIICEVLRVALDDDQFSV